MRRHGASISAWEGHRELQRVLEKPENLSSGEPHVPPFPGTKLAVTCGQVGQALTGVQLDN